MLDIKTYKGFDKDLEAAAKNMGDTLNIIKLDKGGFLVREGSAEAKQRQKDKVFCFPKEIAGEKFLVCIK
jgi:hypothetical protein